MLPTIVTVNPFMAKHKHRRAHAKRQHNRMRYRAHGGRHHNRFRARHHRRRAHNPFSTRNLTGQIVPALVGAAGAIGTDVAMAYAAPYLPAMLATGWGNLLARAGMAVGVGYLAGLATSKSTGHAVMAGGLIVVAYSGLKQALAPTLGQYVQGLSGLADFGDYRPAVAYSQESTAMSGGGMGAYMARPGMGAYMPRPMGRLGAYMNPATVVNSPVRRMQMAGFGGFGGVTSEYGDMTMM